MSELLIRRAVDLDIPRIVELFEQVDELHREALPWMFRKLEQPRSAEVLERFICGSDRATFVAIEGDAGPVVGVLVVILREGPKPPLVRPARVAEIDNLVVDRAARRRGIGKALVGAALAWSRDVNAERTELGVYDFNEEARLFYESLGFATVFRRMAARHEP
jgi:GNAT superfamily N-acetyltransferase